MFRARPVSLQRRQFSNVSKVKSDVITAARNGEVQKVAFGLSREPSLKQDSDYIQSLMCSSLEHPHVLKVVLPHTSSNERNDIAFMIGSSNVHDESKMLFSQSLDLDGFQRFQRGAKFSYLSSQRGSDN